MSLSFDSTLKYGIFIDVPKVSELVYEGVKKPDFFLLLDQGD